MLEQVEIFHGLNDDDLKALESTSTSQAYAKNTVVIQENEPADALYVIESGRVKESLEECFLWILSNVLDICGSTFFGKDIEYRRFFTSLDFVKCFPRFDE